MKKGLKKSITKRMLALVLAAGFVVSGVGNLGISAKAASRTEGFNGPITTPAPTEAAEGAIKSNGVECYMVEDLSQVDEWGTAATDSEVITGDEFATLEVNNATKGAALNTVVKRDWYRYGTKYFYNKLPASKKKLYVDIYKYCAYLISSVDTNQDFETNIPATNIRLQGSIIPVQEYVTKTFNMRNYGLSVYDAVDVYALFLYENPQFYFMSPMSYFSPNQGTFSMTLYEKFHDSQARASYTNQIFTKVDAATNKVKAQTNDVLKLRVAEEIVMDMVTYGWSKDAKDANGNTKPVFAEQYDQSMYSTFMLGYTVCAGYTKAMQAILSPLGLDIISVTSDGVSKNDGVGDHAWNKVRLDGYWYNIDATWDDTADENLTVFFLVEDDFVWKTDIQNSTDMRSHRVADIWPACPVCKYWYLDPEQPVKTYPKDTSVVPNYAGSFVNNYVPAPVQASGTIALSFSKCTYNGKVRTPSVSIKMNGKVPAAEYYTLTMAPGRKAVGKYPIKVTFKNGYTGSKTVYLTINPKATAVKKATPLSKGFKVSWKKISTECTGYQIQYSLKKSFKGKKTVTVKGYKTTSKKITKLKAKKTYYVRVRTYKTVKGKKYYSAWSKAKTVKTR